MPPSFAYVCENGTAESGTVETADTELCTACNSGYVIDGTTCLTDTDRDGIANTVDIDDDNDGLIEIATLTELHNIRYNLSGTSYDTDEDDAADNTGTTAGAPTAATGNCETPVDGSAPSIYLCGYELAADLDFDTDGNGTWVDSNGTYTLDSADSNSVYFPIENGNGGWQPIGVIGTYDAMAMSFDSQVPFAAIFEGNNLSISNLAIQRDDIYIGLFAVVDEGAQIRNVILRDALISSTVTTPVDDPATGALAGYTRRAPLTGNYGTGITVAASGHGGGLFGRVEDGYLSGNRVVTATLIGGSQALNNLGGILGYGLAASLNSNYAIGITLTGAASVSNNIGGLAGGLEVTSGVAHFADNYASNITGTGGNGSDIIGGLVGDADLGADSNIVSNYAQTITMSGNGGGDRVGGLAGAITAPVISSYVVNAALSGGDGPDVVGGLSGRASENIVTSHVINTGTVIDGGDNPSGTVNGDRVGGIVGLSTGSVIASYFIGNATAAQPVSITGGAGGGDYAAGILGEQIGGAIVGSYAAGSGQIDGGTGDADRVSGIIGLAEDLVIRNSYVTSPIVDSGGNNDTLAGLLADTEEVATISDSYVTGTITDMGGTGSVARVVTQSIANRGDFTATATYGFGTASGTGTVTVGAFTRSADASSVTAVPNATALTAANSSTNMADRWSATAWDFGDANSRRAPRIKYADHFEASNVDDRACAVIPTFVPGILEAINCDAGSHLIPNQPLVTP